MHDSHAETICCCKKHGFGLYNDMTGHPQEPRAGLTGLAMAVSMIRQVKKMQWCP